MDIFKMTSPYFTLGEDGKMRHYAVCPSCDNPIQIIGLVERSKDGSLADGISQKILFTLRDHFDRAILVLQKSIGIMISQELAERLLDDFLAEDGHRYKYASLLNIPWMLAYMATSKSLMGRIIFDEDIKKAILAKVPQIDFSGDQLIRKGKAFLQVNMHFSGHTMQPREGSVEESMRMVISTPDGDIYEKRIVFDYGAFQRYLEIPEGKGFRKQELLEAAGSRLQGGIFI